MSYLGSRELRQRVAAEVLAQGGPELSASTVEAVLQAWSQVAFDHLATPGNRISLPGLGRVQSEFVEARRRFDGLKGVEVVSPSKLRWTLNLNGENRRAIAAITKKFQES